MVDVPHLDMGSTRKRELLSGFAHYGLTPRNGVEVGVWEGELSECLLGRFQGLMLCLIDPYRAPEPDSAWVQTGDKSATFTDEQYAAVHAIACKRLQRFRGRVHWHLTDSVNAAIGFWIEAVDFVFLDASHAYKDVLADCRAWWPKVRWGGLLCGHDWTSEPEENFGVHKAVTEFCDEMGLDDDLLIPDQSCWFIQKGPADGP